MIVRSRPVGVLPGTVAAELLLARTGRAAVSVGSIQACPDGFSFTVHARLRQPLPGGRALTLDRAASPEGLLRLGIDYPDGRRLGGAASLPAGEADGLFVRELGGSAGSGSWDMDFWVSPLPPDGAGELAFTAHWPEAGIHDAGARLSCATLHAAARRAVELWPGSELDEETGGTRFSVAFVHVEEERQEGEGG